MKQKITDTQFVMAAKKHYAHETLAQIANDMGPLGTLKATKSRRAQL